MIDWFLYTVLFVISGFTDRWCRQTVGQWEQRRPNEVHLQVKFRDFRNPASLVGQCEVHLQVKFAIFAFASLGGQWEQRRSYDVHLQVKFAIASASLGAVLVPSWSVLIWSVFSEGSKFLTKARRLISLSGTKRQTNKLFFYLHCWLNELTWTILFYLLLSFC
jgi:hypothetical protein